MRDRSGVLSFCLLALSLAGCGKTDPGLVEPEVGVRRIDFPTPLVSAATRAATDNVAYPENSTFGVFGLHYPDENFAGWENTPEATLYIPGVEFMYESGIDDATPGSGAWISEPEYYWMKTGQMSFAAWSPFRAKNAGTLTYGAKGLSIDGFNCGANGDMDLMYSERVYDKTSSAGTNPTYDGIDIVFHHALACLKFKMAYSSDFSSQASSSKPAKIEISRIILWGFNRKGNFLENVDERTPTKYSSSPAWNELSDQYTLEDCLVVKGDDLSTFIIPQEITADAKLKVYYTVQVGESNPVPAVSPTISLSGNKIKDTDTEIAEWKMAKRYVYTLTFSTLYPIKFSVDVMPWGGLD